jgi:hypothetical protein
MRKALQLLLKKPAKYPLASSLVFKFPRQSLILYQTNNAAVLDYYGLYVHAFIIQSIEFSNKR